MVANLGAGDGTGPAIVRRNGAVHPGPAPVTHHHISSHRPLSPAATRSPAGLDSLIGAAQLHHDGRDRDRHPAGVSSPERGRLALVLPAAHAPGEFGPLGARQPVAMASARRPGQPCSTVPARTPVGGWQLRGAIGCPLAELLVDDSIRYHRAHGGGVVGHQARPFWSRSVRAAASSDAGWRRSGWELLNAWQPPGRPPRIPIGACCSAVSVEIGRRWARPPVGGAAWEGDRVQHQVQSMASVEPAGAIVPPTASSQLAPSRPTALSSAPVDGPAFASPMPPACGPDLLDSDGGDCGEQGLGRRTVPRGPRPADVGPEGGRASARPGCLAAGSIFRGGRAWDWCTVPLPAERRGLQVTGGWEEIECGRWRRGCNRP
jgi:hypothetical protein